MEPTNVDRAFQNVRESFYAYANQVQVVKKARRRVLVRTIVGALVLSVIAVTTVVSDEI